MRHPVFRESTVRIGQRLRRRSLPGVRGQLLPGGHAFEPVRRCMHGFELPRWDDLQQFRSL